MNNNNNKAFAYEAIDRLSGDIDKTINPMIRECSKLAQRVYKTRHDWVGKGIHWKLDKKFKFDNTNKWYMHNKESVLEHETHKILWDLEIQTIHVILARRTDLVKVDKKKAAE